jgi:glyoxylase-like metal-dependent hydrolase (beta-lactamase superfamily II)
MADAPPPLPFDTAFDPDRGRAVPVLENVVRVTASNAGPFTFTGTNSFIVGRDRVAVLDPGPDDPAHRDALLAAVGGRPVEAIVLTHTHKDHSAGVDPLRAATGAPLWFAGPHRLSRPARLFELNALARDCDWGLTPDRTFFDGETFEIGGVGIVAIATPGHCANHMSYGIAGTDRLLTGDHIMGWNSTLVAVPDGSMADYLASLRKVIALPYAQYIPAHGGPITDGPTYARALLAHRELRNRQVVDAVGDRSAQCR